MDLKQIRYLVAVADAGSFSAGARRAFVTQPTLSAAIAALEAEVGTRLLERRPRGVVATPEGLRVIAHARAVLRETELIKTASRQAAPQKPLRLGLLPTLPQPLVAKTMVRLSRLDPARSWQTEDARWPSCASAWPTGVLMPSSRAWVNGPSPVVAISTWRATGRYWRCPPGVARGGASRRRYCRVRR